ncbi:hypothetical protein JOQ06_016167 [Pogonophryne albipinna]|uniref:C-type lectin domain-containing protein n=1 Tax=Pogonophryne albipinna TaxID=1090488 RepID=A0AAD6AQ98_9TELE|nr:hypothetical protein JOQ06_016167 [Pogonophryne albipinna]
MKRTLLFVLTLSGLSAVSSNIIKEYHYVSNFQTWADAQSYCRENFDDLATINNEDENVKLMSVSQSKGRNVWIGLYDNFEAWKWALGDSDFNNGFSNWETDDPDSKHTTESCTVMTTTGRWQHYGCWMTVPSVCYNEPGPTKYILHEARFKLKFQSEADLNDPAVQQQILEQLHAKLEKHGVSDFKLRWTQTDGLTFHKETKTKEVEGIPFSVLLEKMWLRSKH